MGLVSGERCGLGLWRIFLEGGVTGGTEGERTVGSDG